MTAPVKEAAAFIRHYLECDCDECITEIETAVEAAIDAATAELTKDRDEWKEAFRDVVKQRDALERERDDLKNRAQSWDMIFAMIQAMHDAGICEDVKGDDALNAYIDAWTKMKQRAEAAEKAIAALRADLTAINIIAADLALAVIHLTHCDICPDNMDDCERGIAAHKAVDAYEAYVLGTTNPERGE